jgi:hypothetical protein
MSLMLNCDNLYHIIITYYNYYCLLIKKINLIITSYQSLSRSQLLNRFNYTILLCHIISFII